MKQSAASPLQSALRPYALAVALAFGPSLPALATDAPPAIAMPPPVGQRSAREMKTWRKLVLWVCGLAAFCVAAFFSCISPLERKGLRLRAGMDENEVRALFKRCEIVAEWHGGGEIPRNAKVLKDNAPADSMLRFRPEKQFIFDFESLSVYFDSNGKVVAYCFERPS